MSNNNTDQRYTVECKILTRIHQVGKGVIIKREIEALDDLTPSIPRGISSGSSVPMDRQGYTRQGPLHPAYPDQPNKKGNPCLRVSP